MPRGSKDKYTAKQKRKAEHIEDSYKARGVPADEDEATETFLSVTILRRATVLLNNKKASL